MMREQWQRVIVVASGPSFGVDNYAQALPIIAARAAGVARVIVVNDNWRHVPNADVLFAGDAPWWTRHVAAIRASGFLGELWTQDVGAAQRMGLRYIDQKRDVGLTRSERLLHGGGNSGHMAVQLAYLFGATDIALVGFDMQRAAAANGAQHHFGEHPPDDKGVTVTLPFKAWVERMEACAPGFRAAGVAVVNCSPSTRLTCFHRAPLDQTLAIWRAAC